MLKDQRKERNEDLLNYIKQRVQENHDSNGNGNVAEQKVFASSTMAVHVNDSWYISLLSSAKQHVKHSALSGESEPQQLVFFNFYSEFKAVFQIQFKDCFDSETQAK